jgi:truncated hemoglobin YjbI
MTSKEYLKLLQSTLNEIDLQSVEKMKTIFLEAHEKGAKIYTMGNVALLQMQVMQPEIS